MRRASFTVILTSLLLTTSAYATGYGLREFSARTMGEAYAGAAASGDEASTIAFNPALLGDVKDWDVTVSATGILPYSNGVFTARTAAGTPIAGVGNPNNIVNTALVPAIALRARVTDEISIGLSITSPWGMITDYADNWVGRYYATMSNVKTYNITPMVAYQPSPELSIGVGVQVQYIKGSLGKAIDFGTIGALYHFPGAMPGMMDGSAMLKADNWAEGYVVGARWKPCPDLSLGLSYRSQVDHTLKGNEVFTLDAAGIGATLKAMTGAFADTTAKAPFSTPAVATFGTRWQIGDRWTALATVEWTGWSAFKQLLITAGNPVQSPDLSVMNYKDTWFGSLGAEYHPDDWWTLRLGTAYDESPTRNQWRTPGIPDSSRIWLSGGVGYRWNDHMDVDFGISHLFASHAAIALSVADPGNAARGSLTGSVDMGVTLVGVQLAYH